MPISFSENIIIMNERLLSSHDSTLKKKIENLVYSFKPDKKLIVLRMDYESFRLQAFKLYMKYWSSTIKQVLHTSSAGQYGVRMKRQI